MIVQIFLLDYEKGRQHHSPPATGSDLPVAGCGFLPGTGFRPGGEIVEEKIVVFRRYPFRIGERLHIEDGPRKGDWEVISVSERKVGLRCPVSGTRVEWDRFCYLVDERPGP